MAALIQGFGLRMPHSLTEETIRPSQPELSLQLITALYLISNSTRWRGDYAPSADASASCATAGSLSLMSVHSVGEGGVIKRQQKAPRHPKTNKKNKNLLLSERTNKLQACLRPSGRIRDAVESAEVSQTRMNTLMHNRSRV